jgi:SAM-dependent methyltransferase
MLDSASLLKDVVEWDVENWSRALAFWERHATLPAGSTCLEVGARRGGLSLWLALRGHRVVCSDLEDNTDAASPLHRRYGVDDRITYEAIDATAIPYENFFDAIAFKSVLGGVAWNGDASRQAAAVAQMHRALKPGGVLLFAENLTGSPLHQAARRRFIRWNSIWRYVSMNEMLAYLEPFSSIEYETTGFAGLFGRTASLSNILGKADGAFFDRIVPPSGRYIMYGVARK